MDNSKVICNGMACQGDRHSTGCVISTQSRHILSLIHASGASWTASEISLELDQDLGTTQIVLFRLLQRGGLKVTPFGSYAARPLPPCFGEAHQAVSLESIRLPRDGSCIAPCEVTDCPVREYCLARSVR